jgi:hypothetical protein
MNGNNNIKPKIKVYIADYFEGFDEFDYQDNIVDMGITDNDFIFGLIQFLESEFCIKIFRHELFKTFTINGIANIITKKMKSSQNIRVKV